MPKQQRTGQLPLRYVLCDFGSPRPPNESVTGKVEGRRLAASWWVGADDAFMDTLHEHTFDDVLTSCLTWRRWLVRQMGGFVPDVDAEIIAAIWEQYVAGVTDRDALFGAARTTLRRVSRHENRQTNARLQRAVAATRPADSFDELVERVAAEQMVARLAIPAKAREWVRVMSVGGSALRPAMITGRRWADRTRDQIAKESRHAA